MVIDSNYKIPEICRMFTTQTHILTILPFHLCKPDWLLLASNLTALLLICLLCVVEPWLLLKFMSRIIFITVTRLVFCYNNTHVSAYCSATQPSTCGKHRLFSEHLPQFMVILACWGSYFIVRVIRDPWSLFKLSLSWPKRKHEWTGINDITYRPQNRSLQSQINQNMTVWV